MMVSFVLNVLVISSLTKMDGVLLSPPTSPNVKLINSKLEVTKIPPNVLLVTPDSGYK